MQTSSSTQFRGKHSRVLRGLDTNNILTPSPTANKTSSGTAHTTRQSLRGRSTANYDRKLHPMDKVTRPTNYYKRTKPYDQDFDEEDDDCQSEEETSEEEVDDSDLPVRTVTAAVHRKRHPNATRFSKRSSARNRPDYSILHNPQDGSAGLPQKKRASKRRSVQTSRGSVPKKSRLSDIEFTGRRPMRLTLQEIRDHDERLLEGATGDVINVRFRQGPLGTGTEEAPLAIPSSFSGLETSPTTRTISDRSMTLHQSAVPGVRLNPARLDRGAGNLTLTPDPNEPMWRSHFEEESVLMRSLVRSSDHLHHRDDYEIQPEDDIMEGLGSLHDFIEDRYDRPPNPVSHEPGMSIVLNESQDAQEVAAKDPAGTPSDDSTDIAIQANALLEAARHPSIDLSLKSVAQAARDSSRTLLSGDVPPWQGNLTAPSHDEDPPTLPDHMPGSDRYVSTGVLTMFEELSDVDDNVTVRHKPSSKKPSKPSQTSVIENRLKA